MNNYEYVAPAGPAIGIVLGLIIISMSIKRIKEISKFIKNKKDSDYKIRMLLLILPFLIYVFLGGLGLIFILMMVSGFIYNSAYILPTILGFVFGFLFFYFIQKYLENRQIMNKFSILSAIFLVSIFLILIAIQIFYIFNVSPVFLQSIVASVIGSMILFYSKIKVNLKVQALN